MIIASIADLQKHVRISKHLNFEDVKPYISQAVDQFTYKYVGDLQELLAEEAATDVANALVLNKARHYLQAALSNFALYIYTPIGSIQFDSSGMSKAESEQRKSLDWQEKKDIQRQFLKSGHTAMDLLLAYLEKNKTVFTDWADSEQYTENHELLVNNTGVFNKYYNIYSSRQTYLALQPALRQVEDQNLATFLCPELITHLKTGELTANQQQVKTYLQQALVAFTIAKVANEGIFLIDAGSIMLKFDVLPTDKVSSPDYGKPAEWLTRTVENQTNNGSNYLKLVKDIILENLGDFNQCASPIKQGKDTGGFQPYNTSSMLSL